MEETVFVVPAKEGENGAGRIFDRETFLHFLHMEVKRAQRYQEFFGILVLNVDPVLEKHDSQAFLNSYKYLTQLLQEEFRESDILGSLKENRLAVLLPFADSSALGQVRSHFENILEFCDFEKQGYEIRIDQICFPMDGTDTRELIRKVITPEGDEAGHAMGSMAERV